MNDATFVFQFRWFSYLVFLFFIIPFFNPPILFAQFANQSEAKVSIESSPKYPKPNSTVKLTLNDYTVGSVGEDIYWYINGILAPEFTNERIISLITSGLGEATIIEVHYVQNGIVVQKNTHVIKPVQVDIIIESATYVPEFYKGRALPSTESKIRAIAVVNDGKNTPLQEYSYRWTFGQNVLFSGVVKSRFAVDVTMSAFSGNSISVVVYDSSGNAVGESRLQIQISNPKLYLYSYSPLRGFIEKAESNLNARVGENLQLYAEPYFLSSQVLSNSNVTISAKYGGITIPSGPLKNVFTIQNSGTPERKQIVVEILSKQRLYQFVEGSLLIDFK